LTSRPTFSIASPRISVSTSPRPGTQHARPPTVAGFKDLETAFQYRLLKDGPHELALMVALIVDWGGTAATNAGIGTSYSTLSPTLCVGKGFGELPDQLSWARPFAATLDASYDIPASSYDFAAGAFISHTASYSTSRQYSLPYLHSNVIDLELPEFFNHLIPLVEASFRTPVADNFGNSCVTTGLSYYQVGVEAIIAVKGESGGGVGVIGQLHFYLDDMFPTALGQPLIGGKTPPAKTPLRRLNHARGHRCFVCIAPPACGRGRSPFSITPNRKLAAQLRPHRTSSRCGSPKTPSRPSAPWRCRILPEGGWIRASRGSARPVSCTSGSGLWRQAPTRCCRTRCPSTRTRPRAASASTSVRNENAVAALPSGSLSASPARVTRV
jgi:hypothetical protein